MMLKENRLSLKRLFWDYDFSEKELEDLLRGNTLRVGHLEKTGLYARMLSSLPWYDILDLVENNHLKELLSDAVIARIHSNDLKNKYAVAKRILFQ